MIQKDAAAKHPGHSLATAQAASANAGIATSQWQGRPKLSR